MLRHAIDVLREGRPELRVTLSAGAMTDPAWCSRQGIRLVPRTRLRLLREMASHDALVVLGGTWLHSSTTSLRYDLVGGSLGLLLLYARMLGLKTALLALGIGPFEKKVGHRIAKMVCGLCRFVSVRDLASWEWLMEAGLSGVRIQRCADPAYGLKPVEGPRAALRLGVSALPYHAGYTSRHDGDTGLTTAISEAVGAWLARSPAHEVVLLPFNNKPGIDSDFNILGPVFDQHAGTGRIRMPEYSADPNVMVGEVRRCGAMIAMRYHSVLISHLAGTPMLVIDYHGKTTALLDEIGFPAGARIPADQVVPGTIAPRLDALEKSPASHLARLGPGIFSEHLRTIWPEGSFWT
jgi:polysaccharide pyruvyl transferase WcaK-like protein